jgi:hypothetical protein
VRFSCAASAGNDLRSSDWFPRNNVNVDTVDLARRVSNKVACHQIEQESVDALTV